MFIMIQISTSDNNLEPAVEGSRLRTTSGFGSELDALVLFHSSKTKAGKQVPLRY
jgi:hypothetical protein